MGGATRFMTLLTTPITPLRPSFIILLRRRLSSISVAPRRALTLSSPSKTKPLNPQLVNCLHSQPTNTTFAIQSSAAQHHPWPEWTNFLNILSNGQGLSAPEEQGIPPEDAFVVYEELSDDFVRAAAVCITFARARPNLLGMLSRRDVELVVLNGTPFLFKSALDTARRMRAFLGETDGSNVLELDKANTVDLMKYILSYTSNSNVSSERRGLYSREPVDSSVRNLLREMCTVCSGVPTGYIPASRQSQMPFGQNIEMKRGDWICQKCNFMNFAKNMKCLECEEARPKKQLTGGEWDCPQCNFFNYGRNMVCLRCDGRRPGAPLYNNNSSQFNSGYNGNPSYKTNTGNRLTGNEEKAQQRFSKISQLNHEDDSNNAAAMKIENRLSSPQHQKQFSNIGESSRWIDGIHNKDKEQTDAGSENFQLPKDSASQKDNHDKENEQAQKSERWFKKMSELHDVKDLPSAVSDEDFPEIMPMRTGENQFVVSKKKDRSLTSPKYNRQVPTDQANNTSFVPFVPFPPGYFSKKEDTNQSTGQALHVEPDTKPMKPESSNYSSGVAASKVGPPESSNYSSRNTASNNWSGKSLEGSAVKEGDPLDMSEEAKAERWFKRVAQIKDISELSQIPDEDFPSIMPMRKGVNRFVVSKRKTPLERRLTSQQYRRNLPVVSSDSVKEDE